MRRKLGQFLDLKRLLFGLAAVLLLVAASRLVAPNASPGHRHESDPTIREAVLLPTPPQAGQELKVGATDGKLAPDFEISRPDGQRVRLSDLRGHPVVLNFWARWCTSCLTEMPALAKEQLERGRDTFEVLAVNAGETRSQAQEFIDFLKAPFIYGLDEDLTIADAYGVYGLPSTFFIDAGGVIHATYSGLTDQMRLAAFVNSALTSQPAPALPVAIRPVTTIPRERTFTVRELGPGDLLFSSRALRCDPTYCASEAIALFRHQVAGIVSAELEGDSPPSLRVHFDPQVLTAAQATEALLLQLNGLKDPVYDSPMIVQTLPN